jgi:phage-related minor tail protein
VLFVAGPSPAAFVAAGAAWLVVALGAFLLAWRAGAGADEEQGPNA